MRILQITWSLLCDDVFESLAALGHEVTALPQAGGNLTARLLQALRSSKFDIVFSLNFNPHFATIARQFSLPYVAWNIDNICASAFFDPRFALPNTHIFCIDRPALELYRQAGYPNIHYLPIGSNLARFYPPAEHEQKTKEATVVFVGCSMIKKGNEFPGFIARLAGQQDLQTDPRAKELIRFTLEALETIVRDECQDFFASSISERLNLASKRLGFDIAKTLYSDPPFFNRLIEKEVSSKKRISLIQELGKQLPVEIFGDNDWAPLATGLIQYRGHADYHADAPSVYRRAAINVNIEKVYNTSSINLRILDAMACGSFVLTERVDDLPVFFEAGHDLEVFGSASELVEKAAYYLEHAQEREAIALAGCKKVHASFNLSSRLVEILRKVAGPVGAA